MTPAPKQGTFRTRSIPLDQLVLDPENPREHGDPNLDAIRESLTEYGLVSPLIVQKSTMMVLGGNGRLMIMRDLGWKSASCNLLDLDDHEARKLAIILNRSGELATWNRATLARHLESLASELDDFRPEALGFSDDEYLDLVAELEAFSPEGVEIDGVGGDDSDPGSSSSDTSADMTPDPDPVEPAAPVKVLQIFLDPEQYAQVDGWCARLQTFYDTDNLTETVYTALRACIRMLDGLDLVDEDEAADDEGEP